MKGRSRTGWPCQRLAVPPPFSSIETWWPLATLNYSVPTLLPRQCLLHPDGCFTFGKLNDQFHFLDIFWPGNLVVEVCIVYGGQWGGWLKPWQLWHKAIKLWRDTGCFFFTVPPKEWLREGVNGKKTFSFGHCPNKGEGGVYPCSNFLALFLEVHFWSIKRVYFFKNANVLNF